MLGLLCLTGFVYHFVLVVCCILYTSLLRDICLDESGFGFGECSRDALVYTIGYPVHV